MSLVFRDSRANGFSLTEVMIALGCASLALVATASLSLMANRDQESVKGTLEAIEQNSEIRDLLFKKPKGASPQSCLARLSPSSSAVFSPTTDFQLTNIGSQVHSSKVTIDRSYLTRAELIGSTSTGSLFSAQLVVEQSVRDGQNSKPLQPSLLGVMQVQVNAAGHVTGCNWDIAPGASASCASIGGVSGSASGGSACQLGLSLPAAGSCPFGTNFDTVASHCVPANMGCTTATVAVNFDGTKFGCGSIPATYAVRYPANYTPPPTSPAGGSGVVSPGQSQSSPAISIPPSAPANGNGPQPNPTPTPHCDCGGAQINAGGSDLCVRAYRNSEGFGNYDDMFEVRICNSLGILEAANPANYFDEDGRGTTWNWRPGTCTNYGGFKNENGLRYSRGRCQ